MLGNTVSQAHPSDSAGFRQHGYCVRSSLYDQEERDGLRSFLSGLWSRRHPDGTEGSLRVEDFRFQGLHLRSSYVCEIAFRPNLVSVLTELLSDQPVLVQSTLLHKTLAARGHRIHQDNQVIKVRGGNSLAVWTALDDANRQNGCVHLLDGSHILPVADGAALESQFVFRNDIADHTASGRAFRVRPLEVPEGDTVIWDGNVVHWSGANRTPTLRRSLVCHYVGRSANEVSEHFAPIGDRSGGKVHLSAGRS